MTKVQSEETPFYGNTWPSSRRPRGYKSHKTTNVCITDHRNWDKYLVWNGEAWVIEMKRKADTSDPELGGWCHDAMQVKGLRWGRKEVVEEGFEGHFIEE